MLIRKIKIKKTQFSFSYIEQVTRKKIDNNKDKASTSNLWRNEEYDYGIGYSGESQLNQIWQYIQ